MAEYATTSDVISMWRALTDDELSIAENLIPVISAEIREEARKTGRDFEVMLIENDDLATIAKSVVVDVVKRYILDLQHENASFSQMTESAMGYSVTGTFLAPGGGVFIKNSEWKRLGLRRQRIGVIDL